MKTVVKFKKEREDKVLFLPLSERLVDCLCESTIGKVLSKVLYKCGVLSVVFG